jgi:outer membrane protein assembly factor BamB
LLLTSLCCACGSILHDGHLTKQFGGTSFHGMAASDAVALGDGFVVVAIHIQGPVKMGSTTVTGGAPITQERKAANPFGAIAKIDASGEVLWVRVPEDACTGTDLMMDVAVDSGGNVYMAGSDLGEDAMQCVVKYDSEGNLLWGRRYGGVSDVLRFAVSPGGHVALSARTPADGPLESPSGHAAGDPADSAGESHFLALTDPHGEALWVRHLPAAVKDVALTRGGRVVVAGRPMGTWSPADDVLEPGEGAAFLAALDVQGTYLWTVPIHDDLTHSGTMYVGSHPDGSATLAGYHRDELVLGGRETETGGNTYLARITPEGALAWTRGMCEDGSVWNVVAAGNDRSVVVVEPRSGSCLGVQKIEQSGCKTHVIAVLDDAGAVLETHPVHSCVDAGEKELEQMMALPVLDVLGLAASDDGRVWAAAGTFAGILEIPGIDRLRTDSREVTVHEPAEFLEWGHVEPWDYEDIQHAWGAFLLTGGLP